MTMIIKKTLGQVYVSWEYLGEKTGNKNDSDSENKWSMIRSLKKKRCYLRIGSKWQINVDKGNQKNISFCIRNILDLINSFK